jgi:AcrR family transcriptional regulator
MRTEISSRQEEIINVALQLVSERGLGHLTVRNVARGMSFSEPALYRHFPSKAALLEAILDYVSQLMRAHMTKASRAGTTGEDVLRLFLASMLVEFKRMPALVPLLLSDELIHQEPALAERVGSVVRGQIERMELLVRSYQQTGEWRTDVSAQELAIMILGTIRLSVVQDLYGGDTGRHANQLAQTLNTLLATG